MMAGPMHYRIPVDEADALIAAATPRRPTREIPIEDALGSVLREDIRAERDLPPFDRVTMDGIAVAAAALEAGLRDFTIAGTQAAGSPALGIGNTGECIEVMTGSMLPSGTDTVIPVERISHDGGQARIAADYDARPGQFVHRQASDHATGDCLLPAGSRIGPAEMAILTVGGKTRVAVAGSPAIAVVSTGDELVRPGAPIRPWQIRCSNDLAIEAALHRRGFFRLSRSLFPDDPQQLAAGIGELHDSHDVLILSGGVSMGRFDHIPSTLAGLGVTAVFHRVLQRPGRPMWFGTGQDGKLVFALPGNPVSSLVCLVRHVLPSLERARGEGKAQQRFCRLARDIDDIADLSSFVSARLEHRDDGSTLAHPLQTNTSGDFTALGGTDGFVELPIGRRHFPAGSVLRFHAW